MTRIPGNDDAERLRWLGLHRLWPVADLLEQRGLLSPQLALVCARLAEPQQQAMRRQGSEEARVLQALADASLNVLVLKGALVARRVYPRPEARFRTDLDILVEPAQREDTEQRLQALGYRRPWAVQSATQMYQSQWVRADGEHSFSIDLHWDLRNHPALQQRLPLSELFRCAQPLPGLAVKGMGLPHALLNASMHFFNDYAEDRPWQGLLDKDLLWRAMSPEEQGQCRAMACEYGLAGLLAESLERSRAFLDTPVSDAVLADLHEVGKNQWSTGLIRANEQRRTAYWFALRSEPGFGRKVRRVRQGLFPPPSYLRRQYPAGSRFGLVGLYIRRLFSSLTGHAG